jgi:hypothetical protein
MILIKRTPDLIFNAGQKATSGLFNGTASKRGEGKGNKVKAFYF